MYKSTGYSTVKYKVALQTVSCGMTTLLRCMMCTDKSKTTILQSMQTIDNKVKKTNFRTFDIQISHDKPAILLNVRRVSLIAQLLSVN